MDRYLLDNDHIILLSGGLASFEVTRRVIVKYGKERVKLWFFDTLIEDDDLYRFPGDIQKLFGIQITYIADGRNPWEVFMDERYIGNSTVDVCSKKLKRVLLEKELKKITQEKCNSLFWLERTEEHRIKALQPKWEKKGYKIDFPLTWDSLLFPDDYKDIVRDLGIQIPRLNEIGFTHNNCGGARIKAGIQQWIKLYKHFPERYKWHENREQDVRKHLKKMFLLKTELTQKNSKILNKRYNIHDICYRLKIKISCKMLWSHRPCARC